MSACSFYRLKFTSARDKKEIGTHKIKSKITKHSLPVPYGPSGRRRGKKEKFLVGF